MRGLSAAIGVMMALCGCGEDKAEVAPKAAATEMPTDLRQLIDQTFPADGEIHVQSRGVFAVHPDTVFCKSRNGIGLGGELLRDALLELGQSDYLSGSPRGSRIIGENADCKNTGTIFASGLQTFNRNGKPYKIVLTVWQNDGVKDGAYWIGKIERIQTVWKDDSIGTVGADRAPEGQYERRVIERSVFNDSVALRRKFLAKLTEDAK